MCTFSSAVNCLVISSRSIEFNLLFKYPFQLQQIKVINSITLLEVYQKIGEVGIENSHYKKDQPSKRLFDCPFPNKPQICCCSAYHHNIEGHTNFQKIQLFQFSTK